MSEGPMPSTNTLNIGRLLKDITNIGASRPDFAKGGTILFSFSRSRRLPPSERPSRNSDSKASGFGGEPRSTS